MNAPTALPHPTEPRRPPGAWRSSSRSCSRRSPSASDCRGWSSTRRPQAETLWAREIQSRATAATSLVAPAAPLRSAAAPVAAEAAPSVHCTAQVRAQGRQQHGRDRPACGSARRRPTGRAHRARASPHTRCRARPAARRARSRQARARSSPVIPGIVWSDSTRSTDAGSARSASSAAFGSWKTRVSTPHSASRSPMKPATAGSSSTTITRPASAACGKRALARRGAGVRRPRPPPPGTGRGNARRPRARSRTTMCPPCSWTMPCTVASPMPLPLPDSLVVKNGSNMRSLHLGRDARAGVLDGELDELARRPAARQLAQTRSCVARAADAHADRAARRHRVARVDAEVQQRPARPGRGRRRPRGTSASRSRRRSRRSTGTTSAAA